MAWKTKVWYIDCTKNYVVKNKENVVEVEENKLNKERPTLLHNHLFQQDEVVEAMEALFVLRKRKIGCDFRFVSLMTSSKEKYRKD